MEIFYGIYQYSSYQLWWGHVKYYDMIEITIKFLQSTKNVLSLN